jgi:LPXTG-site transpeptidase (sortase) family protein
MLGIRKRRRKIVVIMLALVVLVAIGLTYFVSSHPTARIHPAPLKVPAANKTSTDAAYGLPLRLQIPKLNVDANISYMGLTEDGDMDVPPDLINVGWYKYGTKPGDIGSAVIAGHLKGVKDLGVFTDLATLQLGDPIDVRNDRNEIITFVVRKTRTYAQDERPAEIFANNGSAYLNLITCSGVWSNSQQRYSHRLVVFAERVS